jgi:hypothetical protein
MLCRHNGMSQPSLGEVVNSYSRTGRILHPVSKYLVRATWDEHLDETAKAELLAAYPSYQRDARTKGIPQLGGVEGRKNSTAGRTALRTTAEGDEGEGRA